MDFRQSTPPASSRPSVVSPSSASPEHKPEKERKNRSAAPGGRWMQLLSLVVLVGIAVLLISIAISFNRTTSNKEASYVDTGKYQAVFLNNGQVYFGNISNLTDKYIDLKNIYYLTQASGGSNSSSSSNDYSLVKLGCQQIHDPTDEMIINRDQVTFWENLNSSGKVVSSIKQFQQQNPSGPNCSQVSNQTQASPTSSQNSQNSTSTGTGANSSNTSNSSSK